MNAHQWMLPAVVALGGAGDQPHVQRHSPAPARVDVPHGEAAWPMLDFGGRPILEVTIGGRGPYRFILDTGASITVIGEELADRLGLQAPPGIRAVAADRGVAPRIVTIPALDLNGATLQGVLTAVLPLSILQGHADGILSASCFPGYLLAFDYPARRITLRRGALPDSGPHVLAYDGRRPVPNIPIRIAGVETTVDLDTGAGTGLSLPTRFLKDLPLTSEPRPGKGLKLIGREYPSSTAKVKGTLEFAGFQIDPGEISFNDAAPTAAPPPGQLGFEALKHFVVTVDTANHRLKFERPAQPLGAR